VSSSVVIPLHNRKVVGVLTLYNFISLFHLVQWRKWRWKWRRCSRRINRC